MANLREFKVGDVLLTYGMNMDCHKCVCTTKVVCIDEHGIITKSDDDDCLILCAWSDMEYYNDYFPYSVEKEREMQEECDREYNEWKEACRRQAEEAHKHHNERIERMKRIIREKGYFNASVPSMVIDLSHKTTFFRWKKYVVYHIDEDLDMFGVADDGDTMYLNIDEVPVPSFWEIEEEILAHEKDAA